MPEAYLSMGGMLAFQKTIDYSSNKTLQKAMLVVWTHDALHLRQIKKRRKVASFYVAETERFELSCRLLDKRISSASRYDHFGTSPKHKSF